MEYLDGTHTLIAHLRGEPDAGYHAPEERPVLPVGHGIPGRGHVHEHTFEPNPPHGTRVTVRLPVASPSLPGRLDP